MAAVDSTIAKDTIYEYAALTGEPLPVSTKQGNGNHQDNLPSHKKQVSFHGTTAAVTTTSGRSVESFASSTGSVTTDPSPQTSFRSLDSSQSGTTSASISIPSLHESLMRTHKHRNPLRYYEVLKVLGDGSMGSVSKVQKRKSAIGGSARKQFVEDERKNQTKTMFPCFAFCWPFKEVEESNKQNALFVDSSSTVHVPSSARQIVAERNKQHSNGSSTTTGEGSTISGITGDTSAIYITDPANASSSTVEGLSERAQKQEDYQKSTGRSSMIRYGSESNTTYALKSIILDKITDATFRRELLNEIAILRTIDHPNIVKAIETYDYHHRLYLVLELCNGGDLYARDPYDEHQAKAITFMLLDAIAYLHSKDITHRDLKYENIMFVSPTSPTIKIIDFGLSKKYVKDKGAMSETVGTVYTMAPEVIKGDYNEACDVWSIGVIAFMLLSSSLPFYGKSRSHVVRKILQGKYGFKGRRWKDASPEAMAFIQSMLVHDVDLRPTAVEAMKDKWFDNVFSETPFQLSSEVMDQVQASIETFAGYSRLKKLALYVIAHKSTEEEIGYLRRLFLNRFDVEKSRPDISYPEFKEALKVYNYTDEDLVHMFTGIDIDGTGKVSYSEFLAATIEAHGSIEEERIAEAFDRLDSDDTGYISVENLKSFLGKEVSEDFIEEVIDEVDGNHDRRISYDEFLELWDEDNDEQLRRAFHGVSQKRNIRETIRGLPAAESYSPDIENVSMENSMETSSYSFDPSEDRPENHFFNKEKEKSLRGVWI